MSKAWNRAQPISFFRRRFCADAWFKKQQHIKQHKHKNKWMTSKTRDQFTDPKCKQIFECKSVKEIKSILDTVELKHEWIDTDNHTDFYFYSVALRKLIDLQEFDECFSLFAELKEKNILTLPIYNTMIYLCVQRRSKHALKQALVLYTEMVEKYSLSPDLITYTNLISLCSAVAAWDKADNFWKILISLNNCSIDLSAYNTMIDCYVKSGQMNKAMDIFKQLRQNQTLTADSFTFSILISGFAKKQNIELSEKLFVLALKDWGHQCDITVYQPLINGYSQIGNIYNSLKLFNLLLTNQNQNYNVSQFCDKYLKKENMNKDKLIKNIKKYNQKFEFPELNVLCFNAVFKGFTRMKKMRFDQSKIDGNKIDKNEMKLIKYLLNPINVWTLIDYLLKIMDDLNIKKSSVTYGILFHLCNYDACFVANENENGLNKAKEIYKMMRNDTNVFLRTDVEMCNFLRTALNVYKDRTEEKLKFVKWWIEEMNDMKLYKSDYTIKEIVKSGINLSDLQL